MKTKLILIVLTWGALVVGCQVPLGTLGTTATLDLTKPGRALALVQMAVDVPASANGGRSLGGSQASRAFFTPAAEPPLVSSGLVQALQNSTVNPAAIYLDGLKTSAAATDPNLAVGQTVDVGTITLVSAGSTMTIPDAGKLTTRLDASSTLWYYWNLGTALGTPTDTWMVLAVTAAGDVRLYVRFNPYVTLKAASSPGLIQSVQSVPGSLMTSLVDTQEPGVLKAATRSATFATYVAATPSAGAYVTVQQLNTTPWYTFEAYDPSGDLVAQAGGAASAPGAVSLLGQTYSQTRSFRLKALDVLDGFAWARATSGHWYTWPQGAPSVHWQGGPTDGSGTPSRALVVPRYENWLEAPANGPDTFDQGDVTLAGHGETTALQYDPTAGQYHGALLFTMNDANIGSTGHLAVSSGAEGAFATSWALALSAIDGFEAFSATAFLGDFDAVITEATPLMPTLGN